MSVFRFKQFSVKQELSAMKVGTDAMLLGSLVVANQPKQILDVGSGTGVIALMMAQRYGEAMVFGVELDDAAAAESYENFENSPWGGRMTIILSDFLDFEFTQTYDLIVSNPPYYQTRLENQDARKSKARHEAALPMEAMLEKIATLLEANGSFWVIVPYELHENWVESAKKNGLSCSTIVAIHGKIGDAPIRSILEFKFSVAITTIENLALIVRNSDGSYTQEYIELTQEFHYNDLRK